MKVGGVKVDSGLLSWPGNGGGDIKGGPWPWVCGCVVDCTPVMFWVDVEVSVEG